MKQPSKQTILTLKPTAKITIRWHTISKAQGTTHALQAEQFRKAKQRLTFVILIQSM